MSRVAKMPVTVPAGVDVTMNEQHISVKGAGGQLSIANNALVKVVRQGESMTFEPANESREANAMSGTLRQLVNNMVVGVTEGFTKELEIVGVGYRAELKGPSSLRLNLGFSHPVDFEALAGVTFEVPVQTKIIVKGIDKEAVGQVAANIRSIRKPEPYKGKGVRYLNERILRKAGKAGKK